MEATLATVPTIEAAREAVKKKKNRGQRGMGNIYVHRKNYWLDVRANGQRHRVKLGPVKVLEKREARAIADGKITGLLMPKPDEKGQMLFSEFAKKFVAYYTTGNPRKSWVKHRGKAPEDTPIQHCVRFFGAKRMMDITPALIEDFRAHLGQRKVGKHGRRFLTVTTVNKNISLLRAAFYWAMRKDNGYASHNPVADLPRREKLRKEAQIPERVLEPNEEPKLLERLPGWLRLMVIFCLQTATRRGDLMLLTWKAVHPDFVEFLETKECKKRVIPLSKDAKMILEMVRPAKTDPNAYVFEPDVPRKRLANKIERDWKRAVLKAEIPHIRFHDLRHTAGTRMANSGIELQTVQKILGHASLSTTQRYLHSSDKQKQRAVDTLAGSFGLYLPSASELTNRGNVVTATIQ
jgi:integrase